MTRIVISSFTRRVSVVVLITATLFAGVFSSSLFPAARQAKAAGNNTVQFHLWQNLNPGGGGQVQQVYPDPNTPGCLYELADLEGLYRSDDYGASWNYIGDSVLTGDTRHIIAEPGNANRLYLGTNYGLEISDNAGVTWRPVVSSSIASGTPFDALAVDPRNTQNVFAGPSWEEDDRHLQEFDNVPAYSPTGQRLLYYSHDRGSTWHTVQFDTHDGYKQVFSITINPQNSRNIYLGADGGVYVSWNGGVSWQLLNLPVTTGATGSHTVYPYNRGAALTPDGKYIIATYAIAVDSSQNPPDAQISYVKQTSVFVTSTHCTTNCVWQEISSGLADPANNNSYANYARPEVDPRSTSSSIKLLTGPLAPLGNYGLFQGAYSVDANGIFSGSWQKVFENRPSPKNQQPPVPQFDVGWNDIEPFVREYTYTPTSWPQRQVWMASQQTVYVGDPEHPTTGWQTRSTQFVKNYTQASVTDANGNVVQGPNAPSYQGQGISSTFNYDVAGYGNYLVQGMADNGLLESWDGGKSWTQRLSNLNRHLFAVQSNPNFMDNSGSNINWYWINNADSVMTVPTYPAIMLAGVAGGYGAGSTEYGNGFLLAEKLGNTPSPSDTWQFIAGEQWSSDPPFVSKYYNKENPPKQPVAVNGLPPWRIQSMTYNPSNPDQVVVGTHQGLYICYDILGLVNNTAGPTGTYFYDIGNAQMDKQSFRAVAFDPNDPNTMYAMSAPFNPNTYFGYQTGEGTVWKGSWNGTYWSWQAIYNRGGAGNSDYDMSVWSNNGKTQLAISIFDGNVNADTVEPASNGTGVYLSGDQGGHWTQVLSTAQAVTLRQHAWYNPAQYHMVLTSLVASGNQVYVTMGTHSYTKGYAVLQGTIQNDGTVWWTDWTGDYSYGASGSFIPFPYARGKTKIINMNGQDSVYISTAGAGLWSRPVEQTIDDGVTGSGQGQFTYSSGWSFCNTCLPGTDPASPPVYGGTQHFSNTVNSTMTLTFSGSQVALYGILDPRQGIGAVSVDGGPETNVDFYGPTRMGNQLLWANPTPLGQGTHTLTLRVTGTKDAQASDTYIAFDRVAISGA